MLKTFFALFMCLMMGFLSDAQINPDELNGKYSFNFSELHFEVDPAIGGRVSSLQLKGKEILYLDQSNNNNNWGATFWPAPQSLWSWPPIDTLDSKPYAVTVSGNKLTLRSGPKKKIVACSFVKTFEANLYDTSISVKYTIKNLKKTSNKIAPWQITRMPSGGLTFYPTGLDDAFGDLEPLATFKNGITWFDYDSTKIPGGVPKLNSDGSEGWLAHVNNQGILLLFKFQDTPLDQLSLEADEIQIYTDPTPSLAYIEVEPFGPYTSIPVADSLVWDVKWYVRQIPEHIEKKAGNDELVAYVRSVIKGSEALGLDKKSIFAHIFITQNEDEILIENESQFSIENFRVFDNMGHLVYKSSVTNQGQYKINKSSSGCGLLHLVIETKVGEVKKKIFSY